MAKTVLGYNRRSLENENLSLQAQEKSIRAFAESQSWNLQNIYCDHRINIKAGSLETDAIEVLSSIIKNDTRFQEAIKRYGSDVSDHKSFLETQLEMI